jgi:hypothetical protein
MLSPHLIAISIAEAETSTSSAGTAGALWTIA